jgi:hypothetical protein
MRRGASSDNWPCDLRPSGESTAAHSPALHPQPIHELPAGKKEVDVLLVRVSGGGGGVLCTRAGCCLLVVPAYLRGAADLE